MSRKEAFSIGAVGLIGAIVWASLISGISKANSEIAAEKAEAALVAKAPVVRVCANGTFVRKVDDRLHVSDGRQSGWATDHASPDDICRAGNG